MKVEIRFGALAPKIREQLAALKLRAYHKDVAEWQSDADVITRLLIRGLLSPSAANACRRKLVRLIADGVSE